MIEKYLKTCASEIDSISELIQLHMLALSDVKLYKTQIECLNALDKNDNVIIKKSRMTGTSTILIVYALTHSIINDNSLTVFISTSQQAVKNNIKCFYEILDKISDISRHSINVEITNNSQKIKFSNNSQIQFLHANNIKGATRQSSCDLVIVDEAAYMENFEDIFYSMISCLVLGGKHIVSSTLPNTNNYFNEIYKRAVRGNRFVALDLIKDDIHE